LVEEGTISPNDLDIFTFVETADEAWEHVCQFYADGDHPLRCGRHISD
jgi:hypothetical protein